ncbi:hypothetical protein Tco_1262483 [Tanacetum coccineum]
MVQMMISLTHMNAIKLFILVQVLLTQVQVHLSTLKKDSNLVTNKKTDILPTQEVQESNTDEHASKDDWSKLGLHIPLMGRMLTYYCMPNDGKKKYSLHLNLQDEMNNPLLLRTVTDWKGKPSLRSIEGNSNSTPSEQEAAEKMKALKESKKMSKRQPGTEGSNEGTGNILRVPDVSTVVSRASSEGTGSKPGVPDEKWLAPSLVLATTYIPPTDKDLEILFQPMLDEYFEQSTDSEPVPTATVVNAPIVSTNTSISTSIAQDAPSTSHSPCHPHKCTSSLSSRSLFKAMQDEINKSCDHLKYKELVPQISGRPYSNGYRSQMDLQGGSLMSRALTASVDVPSSVTETTDTTSTLPPPPPPLQKPTGSFKDGDGDGDTHYERSHKGVKASANSDIIFFFTSAQDGNKLLDDERLSLADDLKKAHDQNQNKSK